MGGPTRLLAVLGLTGSLVLPACAGPAPAVPRPTTAATTTAAAAPADQPVAPRLSIVACTGGGELVYLDPATGAERRRTGGVRSPDYSFRGTDLSSGPGVGYPSCGNGTFNHSLTQIAGTHSQGGETAPAGYDLATGAVRDLVPFTDTSGFASVHTVRTAAVEFSPYSDDLWYLIVGDSSGSVTLVGPGYREDFDFPSAMSRGCDLIFSRPGAVPDVTCEYGQQMILDERVVHPENIRDPQFVDPATLPDSDRNIGAVKLADDGASSAFLERRIGTDWEIVLWTIPATSAAPERIGTVADELAAIVRIGMFAA